MWYAVNATCIIGPIIFYLTINSEWYINDILEHFFQEFPEEETSYTYFQQDIVPADTTENPLQTQGNSFDEQIISRGQWLSWFTDLNVHDFYLWENLKQKSLQK